MKHFIFVIVTVLATCGMDARAQVRGIEHVVIIGCDGMSPDGVREAHAPVMKRMMREGAFTLHARGVMPTSSSPNWASMIMGAGPEQHGVTSNDWETNKYESSQWPEAPGECFPRFSVSYMNSGPMP